MMGRGMFILLLLDRARQVGGSVEYSKGKDRESDVAILRFLCGSTRPCRLRTVLFWPWRQDLSCVLTACRVFIGPGKPSSFCNYFVKPSFPVSRWFVGGRMR
jgi:hypothetical protein